MNPLTSHRTAAGSQISRPGARFAGACLGLVVAAATLAFGDTKPQPDDLTQLSLEDLLKLEVITTIGKRQQKISRVPAAVYVISAEDIEHSGVTSIPDALRLAPGVEVAQVDNVSWAISIRGFNSVLSNKLLVLVDGRTVYSSIYTQVLWAVQDLPLEDVERIEVIRGPGAAIWGANAVDGVINIVTRSARTTLGKRLSVEAGSHDQAIADASYGGKLGGDAVFRVSGRYALRGQLDAVGDGEEHDRLDLQRGDIRGDWAPSARDSISVSGDIYQSHGAEILQTPFLQPPGNLYINSPTSFEGGSLLSRWTHVTARNSQVVAQVYYERSHYVQQGNNSADNTLDFDFHEENHLGKRHDVLWGAGFRHIREDTIPSFAVTFTPRDKTIKLFSAFGQDEIALVQNRLWLTLGTRLEHNPYSGVEAEPDLRILWAPNHRHSLWAATSRAVRTPAAFEERARFNTAVLPGSAGVPALIVFAGNSNARSEDLLAHEFGYRLQQSQRLSFDLTAFYDLYQHLTSTRPGIPFLESDPPPLHLVLPQVLTNELNGHSYGAELSSTYIVSPRWKLTGSYSWLRLFYNPNPDPNVSSPFQVGASPRHQFQLHSYLLLPHRIGFDTNAYYAAKMPVLGVEDYTRLDAHLSWSPAERVKLSCGLQNLLAPRHLEFIEPVIPTLPTQVPRSFYGKVEWEF